MTQEIVNRLKSLELAKIAQEYKSMGYEFQENFNIDGKIFDGYAFNDNGDRVIFILGVVGDPNRETPREIFTKINEIKNIFRNVKINLVPVKEKISNEPKIDLKPIKPNLIKHIKENYLKSLEERFEIKIREIKIHNDSIDNLVWNEVDKLYADGSAMLELYYGSTKFDNYIEIQINYKTKNFEILEIDFEF